MAQTNLAPLLITLPALGAILFAPIFGKAIDRFSPRPVFLVSLWGYFIFGAGGALIHGPVLVGIDRILLGGFAAGVMAMGLFFSMIISLPTLLTKLDFSEAHIGYILSFISLIAVFSAMVMPKIVMRFSTNTTLMLAFISYSCAHILFASSEQTSLLILAGIFAGIGFGFSIPLLNHTTVERSSEQTRGRNLSWFAMSVFFGQFATSILEFIPFSHHSALYLCAIIAVFCALLIMKQPVTA